jgi:electron transfer flavoprotein alpha subunit
MLTVSVSELVPGECRLLWVIEADTEYGSAMAAQAQVSVDRDGCGVVYVESGATGVSYREPRVVGGLVEVWFAERGFIALFPAEEAMRDGGRRLAAELGSRLSAGVHHVISGPGREFEAGSLGRAAAAEARPSAAFLTIRTVCGAADEAGASGRHRPCLYA